jgi:3-methylfumaryl-CoA hydratase
MTGLAIDELRGWIGRTEIAHDSVTPRLAGSLNATLDRAAEFPETGAPAPLMLHWCLAPPVVEHSKIGADGHPARGGFLPAVRLPRRMWASGKLQFHNALHVGDAVTRHSRIADVALKQGRSGTLCFVTLAHEYRTPTALAITEQQDIVYREQPAGRAQPEAAPRQVMPAATWRREMRADPVMLFRYSALTFNAHRIHFDRSYATQVEGYPGLVVHGPLLATFLAQFAAWILDRRLQSFEFRGLQPVFDFDAFALCAVTADDRLHLWIETDAGLQAMDAWAS